MANQGNEGPVVEPKIVAEITSQVFRQLGQLTRELHDALNELGLMSRLQQAASGLPDARGRLDYIAHKTAEAADKVLDSVDRAKLEHARIGEATRRMADSILADPVAAIASGAALGYAREVEAASERVEHHLTDIMIAQDFHDLTGQVVSKVVALATDLEENLVRLLVQVAPSINDPAGRANALQGPVIDPGHAQNVVSGQGEVDELLASFGF